jgi:hypothetical protein
VSAASNLPAWQQLELVNLTQAGQLSGVDPNILAAMEQAEMNINLPPGVNSSGYGGYFGLGAGTSYPGGHSVSSAQLTSATPSAYDAQAEAAAAEFASLLGSHGGNVYAAETAYQGGSNEGVGVFQRLGIGSAATGYAVTQGTGGGTSTASTPSASGAGWPGGTVGLSTPWGKWSLMSTSTLTRAALMFVGAVLLLIALNAVAHAKTSDGPITVVTDGARQTAAQARATDGPSTPPPKRPAPVKFPNDMKPHDVHKPKGGDAERTAATLKTVKANPAPPFED